MNSATKKDSTMTHDAKSSILSGPSTAGSPTSWAPSDIIKLARDYQRRAKIADRYIVQLESLSSWEFLGYCMKIDPDLEAFFVAIALQHGTHPKPLFGIERNNLAMEITELLAGHKGQPTVLTRVRRNYAELGGKLLDTDPMWFYQKLADAYLDWLYSQEESKKLLADAIEEIDKQPGHLLAYRTRRWIV
jgi:hypothetical protein